MAKKRIIKNESRNFKGVWIPKHIWLATNLTLQEVCFLAEIESLDNEEGCYAANSHFAEFFGLSKSRSSEVINSLGKKGFISIDLIYCEMGKTVEKRIIRVLPSRYFEEEQSVSRIAPSKSTEDSNTFINTNNIEEEEYKVIEKIHHLIISEIEKDKNHGEKVLTVYKYLSESNVHLQHTVSIIEFFIEHRELLIGKYIKQQHEACVVKASTNEGLISYSKYFTRGISERINSQHGLKIIETTKEFQNVFGYKEPVSLDVLSYNWLEES
ncbi:hypothetical protein ACYSNO_03300 [Enterococcus sp. LJL98]